MYDFNFFNELDTGKPEKNLLNTLLNIILIVSVVFILGKSLLSGYSYMINRKGYEDLIANSTQQDVGGAIGKRNELKEEIKKAELVNKYYMIVDDYVEVNDIVNKEFFDKLNPLMAENLSVETISVGSNGLIITGHTKTIKEITDFERVLRANKTNPLYHYIVVTTISRNEEEEAPELENYSFEMNIEFIKL